MRWLMFSSFMGFFTLFINAQEFTVPSHLKVQPIKLYHQPMDETLYSVYYDYVFVENVNEKKRTFTTALLEIGNTYVKFYDWHQKQFDSIVTTYFDKPFLEVNEVNFLTPIRRKIKLKAFIIKNLKTNEIRIQDKVYTKLYEYVDEIPHFEWKIESGLHYLMGYKCRRATAQFRGRKWIAWYTEELPLPYGPFLFGGLPGLILEVFDENNEHHFRVNALDQIPRNLYWNHDPSIIKTERKELHKGKRSFYENPEFFLPKLYSRPGVEDSSPAKSIPYNPIELE